MTYWNDFHDGSGRHAPSHFADDRTIHAASDARHLSFTDILLVAGFAVLAFLVLDDFTAVAKPMGQVPALDAPQRQQICSEEELRHMRSGWDTCFDQPTSDARELQGEPNLSSFQGS